MNELFEAVEKCFSNEGILHDIEQNLRRELLVTKARYLRVQDYPELASIYMKDDTSDLTKINKRNDVLTFRIVFENGEEVYLHKNVVDDWSFEGVNEYGDADGISITNNNTNNISEPLVKFMNKYKSLASTCKICFVLINQCRNSVNMKIGTVLKMFGSKNVMYDSDVIIKINPVKSLGQLKDFKDLTKDIDTGNALELEIVKSNKSRPGITCPAYLVYGAGIYN